MKSLICVTNICATNRKQTASFRIAGFMLAIAPLWLMLVAANSSAYAQSTSSPADWTQFLRDNMQRYNPYETVLGVNSVENLGLKWVNNALSNSPSSPAVVNGVVYIGSRDDHLYALNANTGVKLWSFTTGGEVIASPAVANGVVYIGEYNENTNDGSMYALDARTGALLWNFDTGSNPNAVPVVSSPAVVNGVIYFGAWAPGTGGRRRVCAERQYWRLAVEPYHNRPGGSAILGSRGK